MAAKKKPAAPTGIPADFAKFLADGPPAATGRTSQPRSGTGSVRGTVGIPIGVPYVPVRDGAGNITGYVPNYAPPTWFDTGGAAAGVQGQLASGLSGRPGVPDASGGTGPIAGNQFYVSGDENSPVKHPDQVPQIQQQLVQAGLLDPKNITPGLWTDQEANAYLVVLGQANRQGITADKMLTWMASNHQVPPIHVDPVADIDALAREVISPMVGHDLGPEEMKKFEADYSKWQFSQLQQAQDQTMALQPDQTQVDPEKTSTFAHDWAQENLGGQVEQRGVIGYAQKLQSMLAAPGGP